MIRKKSVQIGMQCFKNTFDPWLIESVDVESQLHTFSVKQGLPLLNQDGICWTEMNQVGGGTWNIDRGQLESTWKAKLVLLDLNHQEVRSSDR